MTPRESPRREKRNSGRIDGDRPRDRKLDAASVLEAVSRQIEAMALYKIRRRGSRGDLAEFSEKTDAALDEIARAEVQSRGKIKKGRAG